MEQVIEHLVAVAGELDNKGLSKLADRVDAISEDVLDIKTAQYVGSQGYWVRNTRCWSNCYRQKRASNPEQPTQEIWADCHEEYLNSINNPGTAWDKYAEDNGDKLIKSASARNELDTKLASAIEAKSKDHTDLRVAVAEALEEVKYDHFNRLIAASNELLSMAENTTDLNLSVKLGNAAAMLTKEAQRSWYNPMKWVDKGVRGLGDAKDQVSEGLTNMRNRAIERGVSDKEQQAIKNLGDAARMRGQLQDRGVAAPAAPNPASGVNVQTQPQDQPAVPTAPASPAGSNISGPGDPVEGELYTPPGEANQQQTDPAAPTAPQPAAQTGSFEDALRPTEGPFDASSVQGHIDEQVTNLARQQVLLQQQIDALSGIIGKDRATKAIAEARRGLQDPAPAEQQSTG